MRFALLYSCHELLRRDIGAQVDYLEPSALKHGGNKSAATAVGKTIAGKAIAAGIKQVAFDRNGYQYHGRVKALADAAREAGLKF